MPVSPNILLVTSTFPRDPADRVTARFVLDLATHLTAHARVFVLAPATPTSPSRETWDEVTVLRHSYFLPRSAQRLTSGEGILATMGSDPVARVQLPLLVASQWATIARIARAERIDVINSHWLVPQGLTVATWKQRLGIPHVATAHAADVAFLERFSLGKRLARYIMARTDVFLPVSSYFGRVMEDLVGRELNYRVIPMGVSATAFKPGVSGATLREKYVEADERLLLFVGKLVPKKGIFDLLEAVATLRSNGEGVKLVIVGGGPLEDEVVRRRAELGLEKAVHMTGWVHNEELPAYYAAADVVCVPSIVDPRGETEGMPVVVQESLASGCIVVATRVSGIPDVIQDGREGLLVEPGNQRELASALGRALSMTSTAQSTMREAARNRALQGTWERVAEQYMDAMEEARGRARA